MWLVCCVVLASRTTRSFSAHRLEGGRLRRVATRSLFAGRRSIVARAATTDGGDRCEAAPDERCVPDGPPDVATMRVREMKEELRALGASFGDCFDRDSLAERLTEARRAGGDVAAPETTTTTTDDAPTSSPPPPDFDRGAALDALRAKRVSELRAEMASRGMRWAGMYEKEELVVALADAEETRRRFSRSGALAPSAVTEISGEQLDLELTPTTTPLLLDVFATWCGPCQAMAPELDAAAAELGNAVRVAKLDTDKYERWSSGPVLRVKSYPTVIVFGADGREVSRLEGAAPRAELVRLARKALS